MCSKTHQRDFLKKTGHEKREERKASNNCRKLTTIFLQLQQFVLISIF